MNKNKKCVGKDGFQRMNYLYQVSNNLATENAANNVAASFYTNLMINISKRTVQRIDINIKRTICKSCRSLLLAGITGRVRVKKKKIHWTCLKCGTQKIFDTKNKNYKPWTLQNDGLVEVLDYSQSFDETTKDNQTKQMSSTIEDKTTDK